MAKIKVSRIKVFRDNFELIGSIETNTEYVAASLINNLVDMLKARLCEDQEEDPRGGNVYTITLASGNDWHEIIIDTDRDKNPEIRSFMDDKDMTGYEDEVISNWIYG